MWMRDAEVSSCRRRLNSALCMQRTSEICPMYAVCSAPLNSALCV
ncbi:unnamed protein product [Staurois parvus]|uniref:Uncharacterized protein n=1 Tax=Staurois parvus TaxID=386267 RepID=A0ABN9DAM7_9NEOB|nr:unnamed protein product [Staurois parvus]